MTLSALRAIDVFVSHSKQGFQTFMKNPTDTDTKIIPERGKKIALARLDIVQKWLEYRSKKTDKLSADYEFVQLPF